MKVSKMARAVAVAMGVMGVAAASPAQVKVLINPGDQGEQSRYAIYSAWKSAVEAALRKEKLTPVVALSTDATADLATTRSRLHDIFVAPAHVIGSALRYGYTPVVGLDATVQAVLVVPKDSPVKSLQDAAGKRLGLPLQDSLVTYLVRGEVNAANTTIKRHFGSVYETRYQDALLPCLQVRRCDIVAVERSVYDRWLAAGEPVRIVMESKFSPSLSVAVKDGLGVSAETLRAAMADSTAITQGAKLALLSKRDFEYVSTLGYFTPRALPGATVVDAQTVQRLMQAGTHYIDTRTEAEFRAGRVPGAKLVPYVEKSHKEADYDPSLDKFDLSQLPADKNAGLIFACNGPECWKSFKASRAALRAGYTRVHWFRGGFPEWRSAGLPVEKDD